MGLNQIVLDDIKCHVTKWDGMKWDGIRLTQTIRNMMKWVDI